MGQRLNEITRYGGGKQAEVSGARRDVLDEVQDRITEYCGSLLKDMEFDREVAQRAEHEMLRQLSEMDGKSLSPRELRLNAHAMMKFRRRTHDQVIRLAEVVRSIQATAKYNTNIQVNFGERDYTDDELREALGVLRESGLSGIDPSLFGGNGDGEEEVEAESRGEDEALREEGEGGA